MSIDETPATIPEHAFTMAEEVGRDIDGIKIYRAHCTCHQWDSGWVYIRRAAAYRLRRHIESENWKSELTGNDEDYRA